MYTLHSIYYEFEFEDGQFVYDVEFTAGDAEYDYLINAKDGSIIKKEIEVFTSAQGSGSTLTAKITLAEAKEKALSDAGLKESEVNYTKAELDSDDGMTVYEIEFKSGNTEYEYEINASTGAVYSKSVETIVQATEAPTQEETTKSTVNEETTKSTANEETTKTASAQETTKSSSEQSSTKSKSDSNSSAISLDTAKNKALKDAGVSASDVTYTKAELDYDDGIKVYDIEFYTSSKEYEYEINASTGDVIDRDVENRKTSSETQTSAATDNSSYIGVDKAKSIALNHAGLKSSQITFSKAKLDKEDGIMVYEVEFYQDHTEYEYTINATTGDIIEHDIDYDD